MRWVWLILPVVALTAAAQSSSSELCGYVYSVRGDWRLAPQYAITLKTGMALNAGDKIKLVAAARPGHINVGLLNGKIWGQDCDAETDCRDAVALPGTVPAQTLSQRLSNLIAGFAGHPPPIVFTLSRGGEGAPEEAVLRLAEGHADMAPALQSMASTAVKARLVPAGSGLAGDPIDCPQAGRGCVLPVAAAGLYTLEVRAAERAAQTVLVLAVADADYARVNDLFAEARRVADSWGSGAHADARHYFLSATLVELGLTAGKAR